MKTYKKHLHDPTRIVSPPDLTALCGKVVPPSEIVTRLSLTTCEDCRDLWKFS
jgi:hypothetical protein